MAKLNWIHYEFGGFSDKFPNATIAHGNGWSATRYHGTPAEVNMSTHGAHSLSIVVYDADDAECERIGAVMVAAVREILRRGPCNFCGATTTGSVCKGCTDPRTPASAPTAEDVAEALDRR